MSFHPLLKFNYLQGGDGRERRDELKGRNGKEAKGKERGRRKLKKGRREGNIK